jgi:hypothetical protein
MWGYCFEEKCELRSKTFCHGSSLSKTVRNVVRTHEEDAVEEAVVRIGAHLVIYVYIYAYSCMYMRILIYIYTPTHVCIRYSRFIDS